MLLFSGEAKRSALGTMTRLSVANSVFHIMVDKRIETRPDVFSWMNDCDVNPSAHKKCAKW